jgi:hypothetical protein
MALKIIKYKFKNKLTLTPNNGSTNNNNLNKISAMKLNNKNHLYT